MMLDLIFVGLGMTTKCRSRERRWRPIGRTIAGGAARSAGGSGIYGGIHGLVIGWDLQEMDGLMGSVGKRKKNIPIIESVTRQGGAGAITDSGT